MTYKNFVITGSGRSGTRYAAELLTRSGLPCAHQMVYHEHSDRPGEKVSWGPFVGDATAFAAPFVKQMTDTLVIHQVRNPRWVIPSLIKNSHVIGQAGSDPGVAFMARHTQGIAAIPDLFERAAAQWTQWNLLVEELADAENYVFWRVENYCLERLRWLFVQMGIPSAPFYIDMTQALLKQPKNTGTKGGGNNPIDLGQIKSPTFHDMVARYGYA